MSYNEDDWLEAAFEDNVTQGDLIDETEPFDPYYLNSEELDVWYEVFEDDEIGQFEEVGQSS